MTLRRSGFGPAMARLPFAEALKSSLGTGFGLIFAALVLWALAPVSADPRLNPMLIAPFGATAFLIFVVPNSPLAQPWAVVVGNTLSALAAMLVLLLPLDPGNTAALAVALAVLAMAMTRALHPPGGAVALFTALSRPDDGWFLATPVLAGSLALVVAGLMWNRATGRSYPFRQAPPSAHGTADPAPDRRHLPPPGALSELLARLRLGANIGVEDLTRLITAAEAEARPLAGLTAADLMSRDVISVAPETLLPDLSQFFLTHRFKTLPVVSDGAYLGLVNESALLGRAPDATARDLMVTSAETASPDTPVARLVQVLADGRQQAIPVVRNGKVLGIITRSDLITLLARSFAP